MERCRVNDRYSIRAFAKSLDLAPSTLSELLNGKRKLSKSLRDRIGKALDMDAEQLRAFKTKVHGNCNLLSQTSEPSYETLALDSFYMVSQWYHYGILQLVKTKGFKNCPNWIAQRLAVTELEVKQAIARLKRIGILEEEDGHLVDVTNGETTHLRENFTNGQLRDFQVRALQIAIDKLQSVPIEYRDNTSMTLAINKEAIPFAKKEIAKFRRKLTKQLEEFGEPDEVYQLAFAMSPLTEVTEEETGEKNENV